MENIAHVLNNRRLPPPAAYFFLFLIYISTFKIFATLPLENLHLAITNSTITIFSLFYVISLILKIGNSRITFLDLFIWILILTAMLSAYRGYIVFGQPYYFGLMAQRSILLSLSGMILITLLKSDLITIRQVEKSFFLISFMLLIVFYYFLLFVNPAHFSDSEFVAYSPIRGYRYRFQFGLIIMLFFYSLFKSSMEGKKLYLIPVALILIYFIYFLQSRTTLVVLAITMSIYFFRNYSIRQRIRKIFMYGSVIFVGVVIMISLSYTSIFSRYELLFRNVAEAIISDSPGDASSAIRFIEFKTAIVYIWENPVFGNGFISNQWMGGWQSIMGYFYPADIGIFGNIFVYGLIGTLLIYLPFFFSFKMAGRIRSDNVFYKTSEYMLLFFFISMFVSALNIRDSSTIMFLVCLIYYFRYYFGNEPIVEDDETLISAIA